MMNCKQATRLLSDAQERELSLKERAALKIHVMMCSGCNNFDRQMKMLRDFAHAYTRGGDSGVERKVKHESEAGADDDTKS